MSLSGRLAFGSVLVAIAHPATALSLGEQQGIPRLGAPMSLDIPLLGVDSVDALRADVPGYAEHARLGSPEPIAPRGLSAQVLIRPDGQRVVRLRSPESVREPILRFLLRVSWPGGQVVREYELLLDPPAYTPRPVILPAPAPQRISVSASPPPRLSAPASARPVARAGTRYGPVAAGDTLYSILRRAYPRRADLAPVADAVFASSPRAFVAGDANRLLQGAWLTLPAEAEIGRRTAPPPARSTLAATPVALAGGERVATVRAGDTLYGIVRRVADVPESQVATLARRLFEANPQAFMGNDMNLLIAGASLELDGVLAVDAVLARDTAAPRRASDSSSSSVASPIEPATTSAGSPAPAVAGSRVTPTVSLTLDTSGVSSLRDSLQQERLRSEQLSAQLESTRTRLAALLDEQAALARQVDEKTAAIEQAVEQLATRSAGESVAAVPAGVPAAAGTSKTTVAAGRAAASAPAPAPTLASAAEGPEGSLLSGLLERVRTHVALAAAGGVLVLILLGVVLMRRLRRDGERYVPDQDQARVEEIKQRLDDRADDHESSSPLQFEVADGTELEFATGHVTGFDDASTLPQRLAPVPGEPAAAPEGSATAPEELTMVIEPPVVPRDNVVLTDAARASDLAKQAAIAIAYEDYDTAKEYIAEAIRIEPNRDDHKMVLLTVHECMGDRASARALMDELTARREQLSKDVRAQVEELTQRIRR